MDLLEYLKMPFLNSSFVMICIIHKMIAFLKNHLIVFSNAFLGSIRDIFFFLIFSHNISWKFKALKKTYVKDIRNLFRLKK